jgi:lauroyl/myristoyl acyltransferase
MREAFFAMLRRSYLMAARTGDGLEVYRSSAELVRMLCGQAWAQTTIFPGETALVRRFLKEAQLPVTDPRAVLQHSLMANPWVATWSGILKEMSREAFLSLCTVAGAEYLRETQASGQGVVVAHCHSLFAQLFWTWLRVENIDPGVTIAQWTWGRKASETSDPQVRAIETARELHLAMGTLRRGGCVHILADGFRGNEQIVLPFFNRRRGFRTTFAEFALTAHARIVTATVALQTDGRILIEINPPLAGAEDTDDRPAQVERLVRQYAARLRAFWLQHPGDLPWFQMKRHLDLPPV